MSQENNFVPEQESYKPLSPFKLFVKSNFPFIEATYEALDNYGLYCKVVEYLNDVISNENTVESNVQELYNSFVSLNGYVSNYFDNLDVQEEINNKLDNLVNDGTFSRILNQELLENINNQILQNSEDIGTLNQEMQSAVRTSQSNIIGMNMLTQEVRTALTGGSTAVVGVNSVDSNNVVNGAIDIYKLDDNLNKNFTKEYTNVDFGTPVSGHYMNVVNSAIRDNTDTHYQYYNISLEKNVIYNFMGYNNFNVNAIIVYDPSDSSIIYYTPVTDQSERFENVNLKFKVNRTGLKAYINGPSAYSSTLAPYEYLYFPTLSKITAITQNKNENYIEKLKELEHYLIDNTQTSLTDSPKIVGNNYGVSNFYKISKGTKYHVSSKNIYSYAGIYVLNENMICTYMSSTTNVGGTPTNADYEFTASNDGYVVLLDFEYQSVSFTHSIEIVTSTENSKYKTMKWAIIGDSLSDNDVNTTTKKYYDYIDDDLKFKEIQHLAKSGCGYKRKYNNDNNFYEQSSLLDNDVDIVTIFGSFNDQNEYSNMGTTSDTTTDTLLGSVYATLNNIITNNPNAKIGVILPTPWQHNGFNPMTTSNNTNTYLEGIKTIAKKFSIPVLELYYDSNMYPWNSNFKNSYYLNADGVHPNTAGNKRFAYQIEQFIKKIV